MAKDKSPAFQFYPADFLLGTDDMTAAQVGGYIRLLCKQWDKVFLPKDSSILGRWSGLKPSDLAVVLTKFKLYEGGYQNDRLEEERCKQKNYKAKQADNSNKRWGKPSSQTDAKNMPPHKSGTSQTDALQSSSSSSDKEKEKKENLVFEHEQIQWPDNFTESHKKLWFEYERTRETIPKPPYSPAARQLALQEFVGSAGMDSIKYTQGLEASITRAWVSPKYFPPDQLPKTGPKPETNSKTLSRTLGK